MRRRDFVALALPAICRAQREGDTAGAARDLLYQALERLWERSTVEQVQSALRLLGNALDEDASFGDAHYYRALCLRRLKRNTPMLDADLEAANRYGSEAQRDGRDPFRLAAPQIHPDDVAKVGQKWALVVGISKFHPRTGPDPLTFASSDAEALATVLTDPGIGRFAMDRVFKLLDSEATTAAIKARLNTIATKAKPEDIVLVYISSHGSSRDDDLRQVSYLYTYDTNVTSRDQVFGTALAMVEVSAIISTRCVAQRTVVMFDTCHSGAGAENQTLSTADFDRLRAGAGRYVLSSCGEKEKSYEGDGHGFFTASMIGTLRQRGGCVRMKDLYETVQKDVSERARRLNKEQHPVMAKSDDAAEIVLGANVGVPSGGCVVSGAVPARVPRRR